MRPASVRELDPAHFRVATLVARRLGEAGHGAWIVGGAARDLARGGRPKDVDMVTTATPRVVEELFERTISVGRAFGIMIVCLEGEEVEVATLRTERGYTDGRHPDEVRFGTSIEEDAERRDFTCNALYLDPLTDGWVDPTGGLTDLQAGVLRAVGDPAQRFAEDGLRLLRLARFQAALDAEPAPGTLAAAATSLDSLRGVSPERILQELQLSLGGPRVEVALGTLLRTGILAAALPRWAARNQSPDAARLSALGGLPRPLDPDLGLAWLLEAAPETGEQDRSGDLAVLDGLRPSRALRRAVEHIWVVRRGLHHLAPGAARTRLLRDPGWQGGCDLALAWARAGGHDTAALERHRAWRAAAEEDELFPPQLLTPAELLEAGVPRGPELGRRLRQLEDAQLEGDLPTREAALAWLAGREDPA